MQQRGRFAAGLAQRLAGDIEVHIPRQPIAILLTFYLRTAEGVMDEVLAQIRKRSRRDSLLIATITSLLLAATLLAPSAFAQSLHVGSSETAQSFTFDSSPDEQNNILRAHWRLRQVDPIIKGAIENGMAVDAANKDSWANYLWVNAVHVWGDKVDSLNRMVKMPFPTRIDIKRCGAANAFYIHEERQIIFCTELEKLVSKPIYDSSLSDEALYDEWTGVQRTIQFILGHEVAHAMLSQAKWPISGREEDVADQFSVWLYRFQPMNVTNPDGSPAISFIERLDSAQRIGIYQGLISAIQLFRNKELSNTVYASRHPLTEQRIANIICWTYGMDPKNKKVEIIAKRELPASRISACHREWVQIDSFFRRFILSSTN